MKKILLFALFLNFYNVFAQMPNVSPYHPQNPNTGRYQTQLTYYDLNYVNYRVQDYLEKNMAMVLDDTKYNLKEGKGSIDYIYKEGIVIGAKRSPQQIKFNYSVEALGDLFVIKKVKITGTPIKVEAFYVGFWKTTLQVEKAVKQGLVYNNYLQDKATFYFNNGNYYVEVINGSINDFQKFATDFEIKKKKLDKELAILQEDKLLKDKVEKEKADLLESESKRVQQLVNEKQLNTKVEYSSLTVTKKMGKVKYQDGISDVLKTEINEFLKKKDDGNYVLKVSTTYEFNIEVKNEFSIFRFTANKKNGQQLLKYL